MKKRLLHIILLLAAACAPAATAQNDSKSPVWEQIDTADSSENRDELPAHDNVEISCRKGMIYISVSKPVKIEIYSILGQLITSKQVKPGIIRLTLNKRGVYILKAGSTTRRINL